VAIMAGNLLSKCCDLQTGVAIRVGSEDMLKKVERFATLFRSEYSDSMSCPALKSLKTKLYNKPMELPTTEDLKKLKSYTDQQLACLSRELQEKPTYVSWRALSEIVLTRLLVFNKRRASEPAQLEVSHYVDRPDWNSSSNKEVMDNLTSVEKCLMKRMDLIQVPGKRNRKVPILITPEVGKAMKILMDTRVRCGLSKRNKFAAMRTFPVQYSTRHGSLRNCLQLYRLVAQL
jgi:hypothetical protein